MYYLAYGSNMLTARLRSRVPSAEVLGVAGLPGHRVEYRKLSKDCSAKCDLVPVDDSDASAFGVVYEFDDDELCKLDKAEGCGCGGGYHRESLQVAIDTGDVDAIVYIAEPNAIRPGLNPYSWYRDLVVAGAIEHALPQEYIAVLNVQDVEIDPKPTREAKERKVLSASAHD